VGAAAEISLTYCRDFLTPSHMEILKLGTLLLLLLPQILFSPATKVAAHYPGNNPWSEGQYIIAQKF
jgi:hypothetical protein